MDGETLAAAIAISRGSGGGSFAPDITDPQDGDTLVYDASEEKWVNGSGGGSGAFVVHADAQTGALDKTWQEVYDAASTTAVMVTMITDGVITVGYLVMIGVEDGAYYVVFKYGQDLMPINFSTDNANGYPVILQD